MYHSQTDGRLSAGARAGSCALCDCDAGRVLVRAARWRVVLADEPDHPAFTRVIWTAHVAEMSDLAEAERTELLALVLQVEAVQRRILSPDKINLASLGNVVPHLHWHVVPRWRDDRHFPDPVWSAPRPGREAAAAARVRSVRVRLEAYVEALRQALDPGGAA